MKYKGNDFTASKSLVKQILEIFNKSLGPVQTRDLLIGYEVFSSNEKAGDLYEIFTINKAVPSPWVNVIFRDLKLPIRVEGGLGFPRSIKKGEQNPLTRWLKNKMFKYTFNRHLKLRKRRLIRSLGKPTETKEFSYWEDREKIVVLFSSSENEAHANEIIIVIYDKKYFSNQVIFDSVLRNKGISLETTNGS